MIMLSVVSCQDDKNVGLRHIICDTGWTCTIWFVSPNIIRGNIHIFPTTTYPYAILHELWKGIYCYFAHIQNDKANIFIVSFITFVMLPNRYSNKNYVLQRLKCCDTCLLYLHSKTEEGE